MRLVLLLLVIALGADALLFSGAYTQAAWRTISQYSLELRRDSGAAPDSRPTNQTAPEAPAAPPPAPESRPNPG
jgi:hypothetical protein